MSDEQHMEFHGAADAAISGARLEAVAGGHRSQVWRARFDDDRADLAVKRAGSTFDGGSAARAEAVGLIHAETARLAWLAVHFHGRGVPIPEIVVAAPVDDPDPVLVTTWVEGTTDPRLLRSPEAAVEGFARTLASLHGASKRIDLDGCPFDSSLDARLDAAAARVEAGLVDTSRMADPYDHFSADELLDRARAMASAASDPAPADRVLIHGDLCVSNVVFDSTYGATAGVLDWAFAGVGDRTQDLAVTARSLARNLSGEVLADFFAAYGLAEPDLLRIEVYALLEELF